MKNKYHPESECHPELVSGSHNPKHSGVSLIIAIIYVSALMLVSAGLAEVILASIRNRANYHTEDKTRHLAESANEFANLWATTHGVGRNTEDEANAPAGIAAMNAFLAPLFTAAADLGITNCADMDDDALNGAQPCVGFSVESRAADAQKITFNGANFYSAPIRGTGDAAGNSDCSGAPADADNPCNWNRMYLGQTVEIPLYYEEANGTIRKLFNPANNGATEEFRLRVRTQACSVGSAGCSADGRLILYPSITAAGGGENPDYRNPDRDQVLVQWSVFDADGTNAITAWDRLVSGKRYIFNRQDGHQLQNTEISSGRINLANISGILDAKFDHLEDFAVLKYLNSSGNDYDKHSGKKASDKQRQSISEAINGYTKPTLRLSLVGQPQRNFSAADGQPFQYPADLNSREEFDIPYLEYQLLTKNSPSSDTRSLIIGWAEIGGFRKEFRKYIRRSTSASGFAIESY